MSEEFTFDFGFDLDALQADETNNNTQRDIPPAEPGSQDAIFHFVDARVYTERVSGSSGNDDQDEIDNVNDDNNPYMDNSLMNDLSQFGQSANKKFEANYSVSMKTKYDINSNIITLQRVQLMKNIHTNNFYHGNELLIPGYIRIYASNVYKIYIPSYIIEYIILYIYHKPEWEKLTEKEKFDRMTREQTQKECNQLFNHRFGQMSNSGIHSIQTQRVRSLERPYRANRNRHTRSKSSTLLLPPKDINIYL